MWTPGGNIMTTIKKTIKTYGEDGKRKYQRININKTDNLQDGVVYLLSEDTYNELIESRTKYDEVREQVTKLKEANTNLREEVETLRKEKLEYEVLSKKQTDQVAKLEGLNNDLSKEIKTAITEKTEATTELKLVRGRLEDLDNTRNSLIILSTRLLSLSRWDMLRGKHKRIIKELAPGDEVQEVEINKGG